MSRETLIQVLMRRDNMTRQEAAEEIRDMRQRVWLDEEDLEDVLADYGLEPDYFFDLI